MHGRLYDVHDVRLSLALLGRGIAGAIFGLAAISSTWPHVEQTDVGFVVYLIVDCVLALYAAKRIRVSRGRAYPLAVVGLVDAVTAVLAAIFPAVLPLRYIGGVRAVVTGVCDARWSRRHNVSDLLTLSGVAAVGFGIVLLAWPGPGNVALPWILGVQVMLSGALLVAGALSEFRHLATTTPQPA